MATETNIDITKATPSEPEIQSSQSPTPSEDSISSNKRIAKNAIMLYIRMFLSMIVGLYTSRIVLNTLGVVDYGIYGVVGGVVSMMGFLNASMAGATSRFITFELGKGNLQRLKDTFSSAMIVHIGIALVVFILAETVGLWFLNNKLIIPEDRMHAAHWVYQMSILSAMLNITQVPYNACIIAHERMGVYAYIEILNVTLKLLIVYLLLISNFDKLILYSILMFAVSIIIMMIYRIYCIRKFQECHFHWLWNKEKLCPLLSFSGWDLYGNMCVTARQQGNNILINMFFGVALNASSAIATTVSGVATGFCHNILQAFRPQIIKQYAQNNIEQMQDLVIKAITYSTLLLGCIVIIFEIEAEYILSIWLGNVPKYAVTFCKILLLANTFGMINAVLCIIIHATGNIKRISLITGTFFLLNIPFVYACFKLGLAPQWAYFAVIGTNLLILLSNLIIVKLQIRLISIKILSLKTIIVLAILMGIFIPLNNLSQYITIGYARLIITSISAVILISSITFFCFFDKETKESVKHKINQIIHI